MALNNMAVSLVKCRCYNQAIDVFDDAVAVMRQKPTDEILVDINAKLEKASQHLSNAQREECAATNDTTGIQVNVITEEDIADSVRTVLQEAVESPRSVKTFLIRIEIMATRFSNNNKHFGGLLAAILLHNYGSAFMCMAGTVDCPNRAIHLCDASFKLFQLSCSNLVTISSSHFTIDYDELTVRLFPLSVLVLQSLDRMATVLGLTSDAITYYTTMLDVLESFIKMDVLYFCSQHTGAAAA